MHPNHARHLELINDALTCISQFDTVSIRQLAFWLYGKTNFSALSCTHRLSRALLDKRLVLRRQGGDGIHRFVLAHKGANRLGIRAGYHASLLNAHLYAPVVEFLTIMHLQGFNVFGRGRIRQELGKAFQQADGLVIDSLDSGYAVIQVYANTTSVENRISNLRRLIEVRGIGSRALLNSMRIRMAQTHEQVSSQSLLGEQLNDTSI